MDAGSEVVVVSVVEVSGVGSVAVVVSLVGGVVVGDEVAEDPELVEGGVEVACGELVESEVDSVVVACGELACPELVEEVESEVLLDGELIAEAVMPEFWRSWISWFSSMQVLPMQTRSRATISLDTNLSAKASTLSLSWMN